MIQLRNVYTLAGLFLVAVSFQNCSGTSLSSPNTNFSSLAQKQQGLAGTVAEGSGTLGAAMMPTEGHGTIGVETEVGETHGTLGANLEPNEGHGTLGVAGGKGETCDQLKKDIANNPAKAMKTIEDNTCCLGDGQGNGVELCMPGDKTALATLTGIRVEGDSVCVAPSVFAANSAIFAKATVGECQSTGHGD